MNDKIKIALIAAVAVIAVAWMALHYSPYQTCVRAKSASIIANAQQVQEEIAANAAAAAEASAMYGPDESGFVSTPDAAPDLKKTATDAKRAAEITCAGAEP